MRTPMQLVTGGLGSGKTTLVRHLLGTGALDRGALIVNEFGAIGIDGQVLAGRGLPLVELAGGCVCCSLAGEFEAAVEELLERADPELIVVEATGVAEADTLVPGIQDDLPGVRLDAVVTVVDAEAAGRYPEFGYGERSQIAAAHVLVLNKVDLVDAGAVETQRRRLARMNPAAALVETVRGELDPRLLAAGARLPIPRLESLAPEGGHAELESCSWPAAAVLDRRAFEAVAAQWPPEVYRAKGFVRFADGRWLFSYVGGRLDLEQAPGEGLGLVWIGPRVRALGATLAAGLEGCCP
ncbi:MAG: GTP-binding protein [Gemmatimonadota bacterium]